RDAARGIEEYLRTPVVRWARDGSAEIAATPRKSDPFHSTPIALPSWQSRVIPYVLERLDLESGYFTRTGVPILGTAGDEVARLFSYVRSGEKLFPEKPLP